MPVRRSNQLSYEATDSGVHNCDDHSSLDYYLYVLNAVILTLSRPWVPIGTYNRFDSV